MPLWLKQGPGASGEHYGAHASNAVSRSGVAPGKEWEEAREGPEDAPQQRVDAAEEALWQSLGPTEQPQGRVKEDGVMPRVVEQETAAQMTVWDVRGRQGCCSPGMGLQEVGSRCPWGWGSAGHNSATPVPCQRRPCSSRDKGLWCCLMGLAVLSVLAAPTEPPRAPKSKLGHGLGSQAVGTGSSSVKLLSLA